jgi:hypothetical protein
LIQSARPCPLRCPALRFLPALTAFPRIAGRKPSTLAAARKLGIIGLQLVSHEKERQ